MNVNVNNNIQKEGWLICYVVVPCGLETLFDGQFTIFYRLLKRDHYLLYTFGV